jgi:F0F1-type ATP synthase assembly protein I
VGLQAISAVVLALIGLVFHPHIAEALLAGGMIGVAGSAWVAFVVFRPSGIHPAKEILVSFYLGEIGKFLIVTTLFIVAFRQAVFLRESRNALMLFLAFFSSQLVIIFTPRLLKQG